MTAAQLRQELDRADRLGRYYYDKGNWDNALPHYQKALAIYLTYFPNEHLNIADYYSELGLVYNNKRELEKSLEYHTSALDIRFFHLPEDHHLIGSSYNNIGIVYSAKGDVEKAIFYYKKSLKIKKKSLPPWDRTIRNTYINLGMSYGKIEEYEKSFGYLKKSLQITLLSRDVTERHKAMTIYRSIGDVYLRKKDYAEALKNFGKAIEVSQRYPHKLRKSVLRVYHRYGVVLREIGKHTEAFPYFEKAAVGGVPESQYVLGVSYVRGRGVERNVARGIDWLQEAARQNDREAINFLVLNSHILFLKGDDD